MIRTLPSSINTFNLFPASSTNHVMTFTRMPYLSFLVQEVTLPGVTATPSKFAAPGMMVHHASDKIQYEPLSVTFIIDEHMNVHRELHAWLNGMSGGEDRSVLTAKFVSDHYEFDWPTIKPNEKFNAMTSTEAGLTILGVDRQPKFRFVFHNLYITNLGAVQFSTITPDTNVPMTATALFEYDYYSIVDIV